MTFRCKIARYVDGFVQTLAYIGPVDHIPSGWSMVMRRAAK